MGQRKEQSKSGQEVKTRAEEKDKIGQEMRQGAKSQKNKRGGRKGKINEIWLKESERRRLKESVEVENRRRK